MKETWSGIDVSKLWFDASWVSPDTKTTDFSRIPHHRFARTPQGAHEFLAWLSQQGSAPVRVLMEATGRYSLELFTWLVAEEPELAPAIVNPQQAKRFHQSLGLRNRTDRVDARSLGLMGQQRRPRPFQPLPPPYQELRELMRQRRDLIQIQVAERQRFQELPSGVSSVRRVLQSHLRHLEKLLARLDRAIDQQIAASDRLRADFALLTTIPGVGRITAATVLAELGDLRRFNRSRQVSALSGLSPRNNESGSSKKFSHIDRNGSKELRNALYMAALTAATRGHDHRLAHFYRHLLEQGKQKKQALVATARKILVIMRALLIHDQPYFDDLEALNR